MGVFLHGASNPSGLELKDQSRLHCADGRAALSPWAQQGLFSTQGSSTHMVENDVAPVTSGHLNPQLAVLDQIAMPNAVALADQDLTGLQPPGRCMSH